MLLNKNKIVNKNGIVSKYVGLIYLNIDNILNLNS